MGRVYRKLPPASLLWDRYDYKPLTGELIRKRKTEFTAGTMNSRGYLHTQIGEHKYVIHRVVWKWVTGSDPQALMLDHKDRNKTNNAWNNLRVATGSQNQANTGRASGVHCVQLKSGRIRFVASISIGGRNKNLGRFDTQEEAESCYRNAHVSLHGSFSPYSK